MKESHRKTITCLWLNGTQVERWQYYNTAMVSWYVSEYMTEILHCGKEGRKK